MAYPSELELTTVARAKDWCKLSATAAIEPELLLAINRASSVVVIETSLDFLISKSLTERYSGDGGTMLILRGHPVTAVSSVSVNGYSIPVATDDFMDGFKFDRDGIYLQGGFIFTEGVLNVLVTYTAGYVANSYEINALEQGVLAMINLWWNRRDHQDKIVEKAGQMTTVKFTADDIPPETKLIISHMQRHFTV